MKRICKVEGCDLPPKGLGYCKKHYMRFWRYGDPIALGHFREKHGMAYSLEYSAWGGMKSRCYGYDKMHRKYYRDRGIEVCKEWKDDFQTFYSDMGPLPFKGAQLDRIDNDKGYSKDNCHWVTNTQNARNKRNNCVNEYLVSVIRGWFKRGIPQYEIRCWTKIEQSTISRICNNKIWRDI